MLIEKDDETPPVWPVVNVGAPCSDCKMSATLAMAAGASLLSLGDQVALTVETLEPLCKKSRERAREVIEKLRATAFDTDTELITHESFKQTEFGASRTCLSEGILPKDAEKLLGAFALHTVHGISSAVIFLYDEEYCWKEVALLVADDAHQRYGYWKINKAEFYSLKNGDDMASKFLKQQFEGYPMRYVARLVVHQQQVIKTSVPPPPPPTPVVIEEEGDEETPIIRASKKRAEEESPKDKITSDAAAPKKKRVRAPPPPPKPAEEEQGETVI